MDKLLNISGLCKLIGLIDSKTKKPLNHIVRYWENEFKQIQPKIINKRRYYTNKHVDLIKKIKYLIKDRGLTIKGVKKFLKADSNLLDGNELDSLKTEYQKELITNKTKKILKKLKKIKNTNG